MKINILIDCLQLQALPDHLYFILFRIDLLEFYNIDKELKPSETKENSFYPTQTTKPANTTLKETHSEQLQSNSIELFLCLHLAKQDQKGDSCQVIHTFIQHKDFSLPFFSI